MNTILILTTLEIASIFAIMSLGVFISFKILNIPDLTIDGSFVLGMSISAVFSYNGYPVLGLLLAILVGLISGIATSLLQTILEIPAILSGILIMTGLYSINLRIMGGKPNIALIGKDTIFSNSYSQLLILAFILFLLFIILFWFLKTHLGLCLIATGDNEEMVKASSINSTMMKFIGFSISNAIVSLSGGLYAQYQGFGDISSGIGMMVISLASIIIGESIFKNEKLIYRLISVIFGSIIYRLVLTISLEIGFETTDLKLLSASIVIMFISFPVIKRKIAKIKKENSNVIN